MASKPSKKPRKENEGIRRYQTVAIESKEELEEKRNEAGLREEMKPHTKQGQEGGLTDGHGLLDMPVKDRSTTGLFIFLRRGNH